MLERTFMMFDKHTNFIGTFTATEDKAKDKALQMIKERNKIRKEINFEPYTEVYVKACYMPTENNYEFNLSI